LALQRDVAVGTVALAMSSPTDIVLAVDGGATRTRAWIARLDGTVLGRGEAAGSNVFDLGIDVARRVIADATRAAWREAGLPGDKPCAFFSVFAGVAGAGAAEDQRALGTALAAEFGVNPANASVDHDLRIAHAGALAGEPGVVMLAGTGSAAYGRNAAGESAKAGGWGALLDDGGSGHWLGLQAMRLVVRAADGRAPTTSLMAAVFLNLQVATPRAMLNRLQPGAPELLTRSRIAELAPLVIHAAAAGDPGASDILNRGAAELAEQAAAVLRRLANGGATTLPIAGAGGLLENHEIYFTRAAAALRERVPTATLMRPKLPPVAGAVLLALGVAGRPPLPEVVQKLREVPVVAGV
jgi:glucosamine kinase